MNGPESDPQQGTVELLGNIVDIEPVVKVLKQIRDALHDIERNQRDMTDLVRAIPHAIREADVR